ncbi:hypothetical protein GA0115260_108741, partial [Streptomyces sp. MnatMP-M27]
MTHHTTAMAEVRPATAAPPPGAGSG